VPWVGLIAAFLLGLVFFLPFPSWYQLVGLVTSASVLMYAGAPLAMGAFRMQVPEASRPYKMPAATVMAPIAFIIANLIVYWSGWTTLWKLGVAIVIGYVIIGIAMMFDSERPRLQWKSAMWLPVYLVGMGVISYFGSFGGQNDLKLPVDIILVAVLSIGVYVWAMATKLPREEMLELVSHQAMPEAESAGTTEAPQAA
jgi:amino acid transporter